MNSKEALRTVAHGSDLFANELGQECFDRLEADTRAIWAVRVLDAYAETAPKEWQYPHEPLRNSPSPCRLSSTYCVTWLGGAAYGNTRDAARIAAATALVAADPSLDPDGGK